jgi:hypothetical protein
MPGWEVELVNKQLEYNDSRAAWMRGAALIRLQLEGVNISEECPELGPKDDQHQAEV